ELRQQLLEHYLDTLAGFVKLEREEFMQHYYAYVYIRIMQALGAYGFRGFYERKAHFLQSVPYALTNLRWLLHHVKLPIALPTLMDAFNSMLGSEKLQSLASGAENLTVRIFSFSFHRGLPKDETGHGGGFIFDGRSLPNPGREERFKSLVEIAGRTLLEITLSRLRAFGIGEVIINVHHFADMILEYLKNNDNFGMRIEISREETPLDTGGGLKKAAYFFREESGGFEAPFILHNVDVISTIDLQRMVRFHSETQALATLAV